MIVAFVHGGCFCRHGRRRVVTAAGEDTDDLEYDSDSMPHRPEILTAKRTMELSAQVKPPFAFQPCA
jgi:hypothetical protein